MKKETRTFLVGKNLYWTYGVSISKLKEDIEELEKLGATSVDIEIEHNDVCPEITVKAMSRRLETDDEYKQRVELQKRVNDEIKKREIAQLEALKKKYEL